MEDEGLVTIDPSKNSMMIRSEIEQQVDTAHKYPRSIKRFRDETMQMVTLTEQVAGECIYSLPRDGKVIEGPSARFAEVIASAWGNSRAGARVVSDQGDFVTAQGVFHDLEKNVAITYEVQRRITGKKGIRYSADMIGVTANAACSIALRNAILKGVPKAFWSDMYQAARATVMGDFKTLANRRGDAIKAFQAYGISTEQICATLGVAGVEDIGLEKLVTLRGILTAIKEGDTTPEQAFAQPDSEIKKDIVQPKSKSEAKSANEKVDAPTASPSAPEPTPAATETPAPSDDPPADLLGDVSINGSPLTETQYDYLQAKMGLSAISSSDIKRKFGLDMKQINSANFDAVLKWVKAPY